MSQFDDGGLPPELSEVAHQVRSHRYEASALELDQAKARILKRAGGQRVARGGGMHKKTLLTTLIMFAALGTGTATALDLSGFIPSLPFVGRLSPTPAAAPPVNAAIIQYGHKHSVTIVRCRPVLIGSGQSTTCTALVIGLSRTQPTGTVTFSNGATCTLVPAFIRSSTCSVTVMPTAFITFVTATYSGDTVYEGSTGRGVVVTLGGSPLFGARTRPTVTLPAGVTIPTGTTLPTGITIRATPSRAAAKQVRVKRTTRTRTRTAHVRARAL